MSEVSNTSGESTVSKLDSWKSAFSNNVPGVTSEWSEYRGDIRVVVPAANLLASLTALKGLGFNQLADMTAVDLLEYAGASDRYEVVYCLLNVDDGDRLIVKTHVNDPEPKLPSVTGLWFGADWLEREAYDMYGIVFEGHPNFKRLLLPQEFESFPLRKDYPVKGRGERHNFPVITRAES